MAELRISIESAAGLAKIVKLMKAVSAETILNVIGLRLEGFVDESFKTYGRRQWPRLAPGTLALRKRGGDQPLQDTGRYKQSFVKETDGKTSVSVGTNIKTPGGLSLAKIHEYGTGPYTIRARTAKVLAARARSGVWFFFGKEVHHPGIPARPVLPTKAVAERLVQETVDGMLQRAVVG